MVAAQRERLAALFVCEVSRFSMMRFLRARGLSLAIVVLVMFLISALQAGISYSVEQAPCRSLNQTPFEWL